MVNKARPLSPTGRGLGRGALPEDLPAEGGAYALHFELASPLRLEIARLGNPVLDPGTYIYAGSAYGPGGIAARVGRHLNPAKKPHWHVDRLSAAAPCVRVEAFPGGRECDVVARLLAAGGSVPVPGFGSTDCRVCRSHLVRVAAPR